MSTSGMMKPLPSDCLNRIHSLHRQFQGAACEVLFHVVGAGSSSKWQHADGAGEGKNYLGRRGIFLCGEGADGRMTQHFNVGREQRKSLVDDVVFAAEVPNFAVPAEAGVASVLDERWWFRMCARHLLQLTQ